MLKVLTQEVYETTDGKVFTNKEEAELHEKQMADLKYYEIRYGSDLTEGREWLCSVGYIVVNAKHSHFEFAEIGMQSVFGNKNQFCMGVFGTNAILPYWKISEKVITKPDPAYKIIVAVEERFPNKKIYGEGIWDFRNGKKEPVKICG